MSLSEQMDTTKITMGRSVQGYEMLVVDNYLYHYEDCSTNTYRWVCSRKRNKYFKCNSRIVTRLIDGDKSRHEIIKVRQMHTHEPCNENQVRKTIARKTDKSDRLLNRKELKKMRQDRKERENKVFTLEELSDDDSISDSNNSNGEDRSINSNILKNQQIVNNNILENAPQNNMKSEEEQNIHLSIDVEENKFDVDNNHSNGGFANLEDEEFEYVERINGFKKDNVYLLRTEQGHEIICINGFLYRLAGKSKQSETYRWECLRRNASCGVRVYTEPSPTGRHILKQGPRPTDCHKHVPYTPRMLKKLSLMQSIELLTSDDEIEALFANDLALKRRKLSTGKEKESNHSSEKQDVEHTKNSTSSSQLKGELFLCSNKTLKSQIDDQLENSCETQNDRALYDPLAELLKLKKPSNVEGSNNRMTVLERKYFFIPSIKGNRVLCLDNYLYHFGANSVNKFRHYWFCSYHRDKVYKCRARIITNETINGTRIIKISGTHEHPSCAYDIEKRLRKQGIYDIDSVEKFTVSMGILGGSFARDPQIYSDNDDNDDSISSLSSGQTYKEGFPSGNLDSPTSSTMKELSTEHIIEFETIIDTDESVPNSINNEIICIETIESGTPKYHSQKTEKDSTEILSGATNFDLNEFIKIPTKKCSSIDATKHCVKPTKIPKYRESNDNIILKSSNDLDPCGMDLSKISRLRSAKGGPLLCVDGFLYYWKREQNGRTFWVCIKFRHAKFKCPSRLITVVTGDDNIQVIDVSNCHTHPINEYEIKRRLYNECVANGLSKDVLKPKDILNRPLSELSTRYKEIMKQNIRKRNIPDEAEDEEETDINTEMEYLIESDVDDDNQSVQLNVKRRKTSSTLKLYAVSSGPPSLAVRMTLKALDISYELCDIDYIGAEHMTDEYAKMNPQKQIPVLDDNGFYLSESVAIMQYLCEKYSPNEKFYPKDVQKRAVINHRLCFNITYYYSSIAEYVMAPIFCNYPRNDTALSKVYNALAVFETYLERAGTKYAAGDHVTIADFALVSATLCLECIEFDLMIYPLVNEWYDTFKCEYPYLWEICESGMKDIAKYEKNKPDLSHINHPFRQPRKY